MPKTITQLAAAAAASNSAVVAADNAAGTLTEKVTLGQIAALAGSARVLYASRSGCALNSNLSTGGGTDDTAALQAMLDTAQDGKPLEVVIDGAARLSGGLSIRSNTTVRFLEGAGLYQDSTATVPIFRNHARGNHIVNPTQSDKNIAIIGGTIVRTSANVFENEVEASFASIYVTPVQIMGVKHLRFEGLHIKNSSWFAYIVGNCEDAVFHDCSVDGGQDGIHIYGPCHTLRVRNFSFFNGWDDAISLDCHYYEDGDPLCPQGEIIDVEIDGVTFGGGTRGIRLLTWDGFPIDKCRIANVNGEATYHALVVCGNEPGRPTTGGNPGHNRSEVGSLTLENWDVRGAMGMLISGDVERLIINNVVASDYDSNTNSYAGPQGFISLGGGTNDTIVGGTIQQAEITGLSYRGTDAPVLVVSGVSVPALRVCGATVKDADAVVEVDGSVAFLAISNLIADGVTEATNGSSAATYEQGDGFASTFGESSDPGFAPTVALLAFDGTNASTSILNAVEGQATFSVTGSAQISTTAPKYGTGSLRLDGGRVSSSHPSLAFGDGDFTAECWVKFDGLDFYQQIFSSRPNNGSASSNGSLAISPTGTLLWWNNGAILESDGSLTAGVWTHVALVRASGTLKIFVDGVIDGSVGDYTANLAASTLAIGANGDNSEPLAGNVDDFRLVVGQAVYASGFTPPAGALGVYPAP